MALGVNEITLATNNITAGALVGVTGQQSVLDRINQATGGTTYFGSNDDQFRTARTVFMTNVVKPLRSVHFTLKNTTLKVVNEDFMRPIVSLKDLENGIPPCMHEPLVYYPPIRKMLEDGAISGFSIDPKELAPNDIYEDTLRSGHVEFDSESGIDSDGKIHINFIWNSDDPVLTQEEKIAIRETREFFDSFSNDESTEFLDFTDYPSLHA